ncbi:hypothetical protein [Bremerella cremea]|uniref:hypothetical protein n=1 Tax=Bremerella cremea TaxID=1031537 RepID=UPI0031EDD744
MAVGADQLPWEIDPYRTQVWIEPDASCHVDDGFVTRLGDRLQQQGYATSGAVMRTSYELAPLPLSRWMSESADPARFAEQLKELGIEPYQCDRVHLISLERDGDWKIRFREFDSLTQSFGAVHEAAVQQRELVSSAILRLSYAKFAPLARVNEVQKSNITLTARGATLVEEEAISRTQRWSEAVGQIPPAEDTEVDWDALPAAAPSESPLPETVPGLVGPGEALQPVLRRNDRQGNLVANGIVFMPWTYIRCEENDGLQLKGSMVSGYSQAMPGRRNVRTQRLAIGIRPLFDSTTLKLVDKTSEDTPLAGYEIYAKNADGPELVGASDANGKVVIPNDPKNSVRLLYVRSGGNLLARLPVVPGFEQSTTARITNDGPRLLAEGFVEGWRDQLIDTMARRQILSQRVERKIEEGEIEEAERWLAALRSGRTVNELAFDLRTAKGQFLKDNKLDPTIKRRIDQLFEKGQRLVAQDKSLLVEGKLARDLEAAKKNASQP